MNDYIDFLLELGTVFCRVERMHEAHRDGIVLRSVVKRATAEPVLVHENWAERQVRDGQRLRRRGRLTHVEGL
ncbi:hypothetical protein [Alloacidobacterium sp.]|uniref:hypothetical protein n=1 Tax=Alloacidobacterium sp. TaxID=2951999 RepID=UPI002D606755|nr:hypothetical protein [Alloacidobacterium sp.]HYK36309.1 hypothetical protein [Alloacidobacterium sp.]